MGLLGIASDVRVSVAANWVEYEKARAIGILESLDYIAQDAGNSYFCMKFNRTEFSPPNLEDIQRQYDAACKWRKEIARILKSIDKDKTPAIAFEDLPPPTFNSGPLNETVDWLRERLKDYGDQLSTLEETKIAAEISPLESTLKYFSPFLLCAALAIRVTKVTGEIRYET